MKGFYIEITNNLLEPKHLKAMRESVWLFMWLLDKITSITEDGRGIVLGGKPIKYEEVREELGISRSTYLRWVDRLERENYINVVRAPYGIIFSVNKAKKVFNRDVNRDVSKMKQRCVKNETSDMSEMTHLIKTISIGQNNIYTPLGKDEPSPNDFNNKLFSYFKQITGYNPSDRGEDRQKYPRLIRQKYPDLNIVAKSIKWALSLHNKEGLYYWRASPITLAKLYHRIIPAYLEEIKKRENIKKIKELKSKIGNMPLDIQKVGY